MLGFKHINLESGMIQPIKDDYPTANLTSNWKIKIIYNTGKRIKLKCYLKMDLKQMKP